MNEANDRAFQQRIRRIEALIHDLDRTVDPKARDNAKELMQAVLDLHGVGLQRSLEIIADAGDLGRTLIHSLGNDALVGSVLLLHNLHPMDLETRVRQALDLVRPSLRLHGGSVELLGIEAGTVRLRLEGSCDGCPSAAATMKSTIEEAIFEKAPDVAAIEVEGIAEPVGEVNGHERFALPVLQR